MTKKVPPSVTATMWLADGSISNELTGDRLLDRRLQISICPLFVEVDSHSLVED